MSKHLKMSILKALGLTVFMAFIFYMLSNNYDGVFDKDIKTIVIQSVGTGFLFGISVYFFDRPKEKE